MTSIGTQLEELEMSDANVTATAHAPRVFSEPLFGNSATKETESILNNQPMVALDDCPSKLAPFSMEDDDEFSDDDDEFDDEDDDFDEEDFDEDEDDDFDDEEDDDFDDDFDDDDYGDGDDDFD